MKIIEINKINDLEPYREVWDNLLRENKTRNGELTFDWNVEWFRHGCKNSKLKVLIAEEKNELVGIAPLMVSEGKVEFIATHISNYADFIIPEKNKELALKNMCNYLDEKCGDFNQIDLDFIPEPSSTIEIMKKITLNNQKINIQESKHKVALTVPINKPWNEYVREIKRTKKNVMTNTNNIKKLGDLSFEHYFDCESINFYLDFLFEYKKKRLRLDGISNIFENENVIEFFRKVSEKLSAKNSLDLAVLKLNGHPISFLYTLLFDKRYLLNLTSFDLRYSEYSPGKMVFFYFIKDAFKNGFKEVDLGGGAPRYKYFFTKNVIKVLNIKIKRKNPVLYNVKKYFRLIKRKVALRSEVRTFFYHRIKVPTKEELQLERSAGCPFYIESKLFEKQIKIINNNHKIISIDDFLENKIPKNAAMITFDDGYKDFYTNGFPILKKYKIPATIFLITNFVGTKKAFWWDEILNMIFNTRAKSFGKFKLASYKDKTKFLHYLLHKFNEINNDEKNYYIKVLKDQLGYAEIEGDNLSWDNIVEMKEGGISIGSHTMSHPVLTKVTPEKAKEEILNSKIKIEEKIKEKVKGFAYPHGYYNEEIKNIVKSSGYQCAFIITAKTNSINDDLFELERSFFK